MADATTPTWGYKPDGSAEIFTLAAGEPLPDGWEASPSCIVDPGLATADALSAAAEGRAYRALRADAVSGFRLDGEAAPVDPDALATALAEIERLQAIISAGTEENARLVAELEGADEAMETAAAQVVALKASLEAAQSDGGFALAELTDARGRIDTLSAELTKARADLDELLTAPAAKTGKAK